MKQTACTAGAPIRAAADGPHAPGALYKRHSTAESLESAQDAQVIRPSKRFKAPPESLTRPRVSSCLPGEGLVSSPGPKGSPGHPEAAEKAPESPPGSDSGNESVEPDSPASTRHSTKIPKDKIYWKRLGWKYT